MTHRVVVPFKRWHLQLLIDDGPPAVGEGMNIPEDGLRQLEASDCWTLILDGYPLACVGLVENWHGRFQAWTYLSARTGPFMGWITREVKRLLSTRYGRIEMTTDATSQAAQRWAAMLGFEVETPLLRRFGPQGEDHVGYVLIKEKP